jgi:hypothetical protein
MRQERLHLFHRPLHAIHTLISISRYSSGVRLGVLRKPTKFISQDTADITTEHLRIINLIWLADVILCALRQQQDTMNSARLNTGCYAVNPCIGQGYIAHTCLNPFETNSGL